MTGALVGGRTENVLCGSWDWSESGLGVGDKKNSRSRCCWRGVLSTRWGDVVEDVWCGPS